MEFNETHSNEVVGADSVCEPGGVDSSARLVEIGMTNKVVQFPAGRFVRPPHRVTLPRRKGRGNGLVYMSAAVSRRKSLTFDPSPLLNQAQASSVAPKRPRPETTIIFGPSAWQLPENWNLPLGGTSFGGLNLPPTGGPKRESFFLLQGRNIAPKDRDARTLKPKLSLLPTPAPEAADGSDPIKPKG